MIGRAALALTLAPLLACVVLQVWYVDAYAISHGDVATLELRILHALRFEQTLGPYSRFDVSHPGPVFFYLLAPVYALSGRAAGSMYVAAAAINLAAMVAIVRVTWSRVDGALSRAAVIVATTGVLAILFEVHAPFALATPWNPYVTIVPFGLLLVLVAASDSRSHAWAPAIVGLHAFVGQTHAVYLLPATAVLVLAFAWRRDKLLIAVPIAAVLWLPVAIDEIDGTHNLSQIAALARPGLSGTETLTTLADHLAFGSPLVLLLLLGALASARWRLRDEHGTFRARLVIVALVTVAAAVVVVVRLDAPRSYLTAWLWIVAFVAWLAVALAWLPTRTLALPMIAAAIAACVSGVHQLRVLTERMHELARAKPRRERDVLRLLDEYDALRPAGAPLLISRVPGHWHTFVALALQLRKRGDPFVVEPKWQHLMGEGIAAADAAPHTIDLVEREGMLVLIAEPDRPIPAMIVDALGVEGDLALVRDADAPPDGTRPTQRNSVELVDGSITLRLDADAERLRITAIGDDWFRIEGSFDGMHFDQLALTPRAGPGLRTREIDLPAADVRPYPYLRISSYDGPWPFWIAELTPLGR